MPSNCTISTPFRKVAGSLRPGLRPRNGDHETGPQKTKHGDGDGHLECTVVVGGVKEKKNVCSRF